MTPADYLINLTLSVILIVGAYQFYFWCQRNHLSAPRELGSRIDERIPYWPSWVWIYSCIYNPLILYLNFIVDAAGPSACLRWSSASMRARIASPACMYR